MVSILMPFSVSQYAALTEFRCCRYDFSGLRDDVYQCISVKIKGIEPFDRRAIIVKLTKYLLKYSQSMIGRSKNVIDIVVFCTEAAIRYHINDLDIGKNGE